MNGVLAPAAERPVEAAKSFRTMLATLANGLELRGTTRICTAAQVAVLHARELVLEAALVPGPLQRIRLAVALLLSDWHPGRNLGRERAEAIVGNYSQVLEPLPAWSVEAACLLLVRGQVAGVNPDYAPSAARVYVTSRDQIVPFRAELVVIRKVLACSH